MAATTGRLQHDKPRLASRKRWRNVVAAAVVAVLLSPVFLHQGVCVCVCVVPAAVLMGSGERQLCGLFWGVLRGTQMFSSASVLAEWVLCWRGEVRSLLTSQPGGPHGARRGPAGKADRMASLKASIMARLYRYLSWDFYFL